MTSANFYLDNTSAFAGYAMNAGTSATADFTIPSSYTSFSGKTASKTINVYDYGGFTTVRVVISGLPDKTMRIPKDDVGGGNWLPDSGWKIWSGAVVTETDLASDDADSSGQNPNHGDGIVAFEEYRGFVMQGTHRRTDPRIKQLFFHTPLPEGVGDAPALLTVLIVDNTEFNQFTQINFNYTNSGYGGDVPSHYSQKALNVVDVGYKDGVFGEVVTIVGPPPPSIIVPNLVQVVRVYTQFLREVSPTHINDQMTPDDPPDPEKTRQTIGHEVGHAVNLGDDFTFGCPAQTIMISGYFSKSSTFTCPWLNIPHSFKQTELDYYQMRVGP